MDSMLGKRSQSLCKKIDGSSQNGNFPRFATQNGIAGSQQEKQLAKAEPKILEAGCIESLDRLIEC
jgi:hypothetical protein